MSEPSARVIRYIELGYSAERIAQLMGWQVDVVRGIKAQRHVFGGATNVIQIYPSGQVEVRPQA